MAVTHTRRRCTHTSSIHQYAQKHWYAAVFGHHSFACPSPLMMSHDFPLFLPLSLSMSHSLHSPSVNPNCVSSSSSIASAVV